MSTDDTIEAFDYDEAEGRPASSISAAQWARAEALKAVLSAGTAVAHGAEAVEMMVDAYAHLIIAGGLPKPPPGVEW